MFLADPSGTMVGYLAKGLGSAEEGIEGLLEKNYKHDLNLVEAETLALAIMKQVMEEKLKGDNIDVFVLRKDMKKFEKKDQKDIERLIATLPELV